MADDFGSEYKGARESIEAQKAKLQLEQEILKVQREQNTVSKSNLDLAERQNELEDLRIKLQEERQVVEELLAKNDQVAAAEKAKHIEKLRKEVELKEKSLALQEAIADHADNQFKRAFSFMYSEVPETSIGAFLTDRGNFSQRMFENMAKLSDGMSVMRGTIDTVVQQSFALARAQDAAAVSFARATGQGTEFIDNIANLERNMFTAGVTSAEASQAIQSLFTSVSDFTEMSEAQQAVLSENVAVLQELGVKAATSSKNIQFSTKVLGMSVDQSARLQRELLTFAQDLGVSAEQIASDFASMGPQIAALGTNGVDAFRRLEVQSKNTGLQLSEILSIVSKFDKFDTAAESVGKLNALLGGPYLNSLELVAETDPSKRLEILKKGIDAAGLSFDQMDYYQRKSIASAAGLNEQQLALLMRGRTKLIEEPQKSAADLEALAEQTAQFNSVMEELTQTLQGLAISFAPVISLLKGSIQLYQTITQAGGPLIGFLLNLATIYGISKLAGYLFAGSLSAVAAAAPPAGAAGAAAAPGIASLGTAASSAIPFLLTLGFAIGAIGAGIGAATAGIGYLISSLGNFTSGLSASMSLTAISIRDIVDSINELDTIKTVTLATAMTPLAAAAPVAALASAAVGTVTRTATPATAAPVAASGPPPVININLQIDGKEFAAVVNDVSVEKYSGGKPSEMYASIIGMIEQGFIRGV